MQMHSAASDAADADADADADTDAYEHAET